MTSKVKTVNKITSDRLLSWLPYIVLFSGMYIWFTYVAGYILFFQEKSALFILSFDYLSETITKPGGFVVWLSGLLTSFYYYPASGAIVISLTITIIAFILSHTLFTLSGKNEKILPFVTALLLFLLHTDYSYFLMNSLGILLQILFFYFVIRTIHLMKGWLAIIFLPVLYFLTGGFVWVFIFLLILYFLLFFKERIVPRISSIFVLMSLIFGVSGSFIFFENASKLLFSPVIFPVEKLSALLFTTTSILIILLPLIAVVRFPVLNFFRLTYSSEKILRSALLLCAVLLISIYSFDRKDHNYFHVEKLFYERKFGDIIRYNTEHPSTNSLTLFYNNIALSETDQLNDKLFSFIQTSDGKTLFLKWEMVTEILKRGGYFYYTTGMINEAHRWAYENIVMSGMTPEGIKMLIKTELINCHYRMAEKYIRILKKTLFYKNEARRLEKFLYNDEAVESDAELGSGRKTRVKSDFFTITDDPIVNVERVIQGDSLNRSAFGYFMAFSLLKKDYKSLSRNAVQYERLGYKAFPVHIEEALLAIETMNNSESAYKGCLKISKATQDRWIGFLTIFQQYGNNPRAAEPALRKSYGNTFWYWAFYK